MLRVVEKQDLWCASVRGCIRTGTPTRGRWSDGVASSNETHGLERRFRERLDALGPAPRAELLHGLMFPDFERADRIAEFWGYPEIVSGLVMLALLVYAAWERLSR